MTRLLYFAWVREAVGRAEDEFSLPDEVATVADLMVWLQAKGPGYMAAFSQDRLVRCAVDQEFAGPAAGVRGAEEIAFFPPVTGG